MNINEIAREELLKSVEGLSDEQLNRVVEEGNWSIAQILEHLYLTEGTVGKLIQRELQKDNKQPADEKPVHLTVNRSQKFNAPSYLVPSTNHKSLEEMKEKLNQSRSQLMAVVDDVDDTTLQNKSYLHPAFGTLNLKQWYEFIGYHERRHIAQIEEVKASLSIQN